MLRKKTVLPDQPFSLPSQEIPVWLGPTEDGISQTMLGRYLTCPERFRIMYVEGLQPAPSFRPQIEFGNLWHAAEEAYAEHGDLTLAINPDQTYWERAVYDYGNKLGDQYPMQRDQVIHWIKVTIALFPAYIQFWRKHPDMLNRKPLLQEEKFVVPYTLPSGRTVKLRGKWDSVDLVTKKVTKTSGLHTLSDHQYDSPGIWLQENKTKSSIDKQKIERMLKYDLQTMLYIITLHHHYEWNETAKFPADTKIKGVRYNVIRRSTHKTAESMMKKVQEDCADGRGEEWFCRWNSEITDADISAFKRQTLDPVLENLCNDYEWWCFCTTQNKLADVCTSVNPKDIKTTPFNYQTRRRYYPEHQARHFVMPYIGYNPLSEGGESDVDRYLFTGSEAGLQRIEHKDLFPELA